MKTVSGVPTPRTLVALTFCLLVWSTGCFLDFDEFEDPQSGDVGVENDVDAEVPEDAPGDDVEDDTDADEINPDPADVGGYCEEDGDCANSGVCKGNICLTPCEENADCPDFASCYQIGTQNLCAPRCTDTKSCSQYTDRDDLHCAYLVQTSELGPSPHHINRACLTDSDDDGVFDALDNCPDTQNPTQQDSTGDGIGDACSDTPLCHQDSSDGVLEYDTTTFRTGKFAVPPVIDGRWLPVVGTLDEAGSPESSFLLLDRHSGEWHESDTLRFAGDDRRIGRTNTGGFIITPGTLPTGGDPVGGWTTISPDGDISYGPDHNAFGTGQPLGGPLRFANGATQRITTQVIENDLNDQVRFYVERLSASLSNIGNTLLLNTNISTGESNDWVIHDFIQTDGSLGSYVWRESTRQIYLLHSGGPQGTAQNTNQSSTLTIPSQWDYSEVEEVEDLEDLSDFDPFVFPAPGGQLFVFDRNTGRAGRFTSERNESAIFQRTYSNFERLPEYDIDDVLDFDQFTPYLLPDARGLGLIGRPIGEPETLLVREIYMDCHPDFQSLDSDDDGVADILDNCPLLANPDQEDLDGDSWGDLCDPDIDGDAIPNINDFIEVDTGEVDGLGEPIIEQIDTSFDRDNDLTSDENDDNVDGDQIPNQYDPFPADSSNNGTPNKWTSDASGNNLSDTFQRNNELDPYDFFSLPAGRTFAFLTENASGNRMLHHSAITTPAQSTPVALSAGVNPHQISYSRDGQFLIFLADEPGESDLFYVYDMENEEIAFSQQVFSPLRSITMIDEDTFIAVHERDEPGQWQVSRIDLSGGFSRIELFSGFNYIWQADIFEDFVFFLGADTDCRECASAYTFNTVSGEYKLLQNSLTGLEEIYFQHGMAGFITRSEDPSETIFTTSGQAGTYNFGGIELDEHFDDITSISFSRRRTSINNPVPFQRPFVMATMTRWGQTPDIWISGGSLAGWHLLFASNDAIVEATWAP